jgi:hypothetical protein
VHLERHMRNGIIQRIRSYVFVSIIHLVRLNIVQ